MTHFPVSDYQIALIGIFFMLFLYLFVAFVQWKLEKFIADLDDVSLAKFRAEDESKLQ